MSSDDDFQSSISAVPAPHPGRGGPRRGTVTAARVQAQAAQPEVAPVSAALPGDRAPPPGAKLLLDLNPDDCRWPFGHGPFLHCAAPIERKPDDPALRCYCDYHELVRSHGSVAADQLWRDRSRKNRHRRSTPAGAVNGKTSREENHHEGEPPTAQPQD